MDQTTPITIRQATIEDKPAIFDFLRVAYPDRWRYKFPERWEWEFEQNPFWTGAGLPIWIALDGSRIIGQSAALVEPLILSGVEVRVGWGVDFYVLPEYRGQGVGTRLQQANNTGNPVFMSLSMAASAARIKSNLGMQPLPKVPLFTKIVQHEPDSVLVTLGKRTGIPEPFLRVIGLHRLGASFLNARVRRRDRGLHPQPVEGVVLTPVSQFSSDFDDFWTRISGKFTALIRRDSVYLNWKFSHQPHVHHEKWIARKDGTPTGYVIFRRAQPPERNAGLILDLFTDPEDGEMVKILLGVAIQSLQAQGVSYIQCASSVPAFQRALIGLGFKQTKRATPMIRAGVTVPQEGWLLGKGDHDWDQFPLA